MIWFRAATGVVLLLAGGELAHAGEPGGGGREALLVAHCPRQADEYVGEVEGKVLLHRELVGRGELEEPEIRASVEQQLRYLWGYQHNEPGLRRAWQLVFSSEPMQIELLGRSEVPYGRSLAVGWTHGAQDPQLRIEDPYTRRAVERGRIEARDPALLVSYRARVKVALCGRARVPDKVLSAPVPRDPWLAYWYVPRARHRPLAYFGDRAVTNPCADDDFASLPHPFYYWYDWFPERHGPDAEGRPFDCRPLLRKGRDFDWIGLRLEPREARSVRGDLSTLRTRLLHDANRGPLRATFVFGVLDHRVLEPSYASWVERLGEGRGASELARRVAGARHELARSAERERGLRMLLETLGEIGATIDVERHQSRVDDGYLVVEILGRLSHGGHAIRLRLVLGLTDVLGPRPPGHWRFLRDALLEDHVVVYWGHSGVGENFRLAQIEQHLRLDHDRFARELEEAPVRLVAYISCYSYMYFGRDLLRAAAERLSGVVFLFTGMGGTARDDGPSAVLALLDRVLASDNPSGRIDRLEGVGQDEFWIVKEVAGAAP